MRIPQLVLGLAVAGFLVISGACASDEPGWAFYGGDQGGQRFSRARQVSAANVTNLQIAWTYSTRDMVTKAGAMEHASFEDTPILAGGRLYVCSPFSEVSAIDPGTGRQIWRFDPRVDPNINYPNDFVCRGVAYWRVPGASGACATRIYLATIDRRLIALDAATGRTCSGFGDQGTVTLALETAPNAPPMAYATRASASETRKILGLPPTYTIPRWWQVEIAHAEDGRVIGWYRKGSIQSTSAPVVSNGVVVVGSSIDDNQRVDELRGTVHAYDAITGAPKWSWIRSRISARRFAAARRMFGLRFRRMTRAALSTFRCRARAPTSGADSEKATATTPTR